MQSRRSVFLICTFPRLKIFAGDEDAVSITFFENFPFKLFVTIWWPTPCSNFDCVSIIFFMYKTNNGYRNGIRYLLELVAGLEPATCALRNCAGTVKIAIYSDFQPFLLALLSYDYSLGALICYGFPLVNGHWMVIKSVRKNTNASIKEGPELRIATIPVQIFYTEQLKASWKN